MLTVVSVRRSQVTGHLAGVRKEFENCFVWKTHISGIQKHLVSGVDRKQFSLSWCGDFFFFPLTPSNGSALNVKQLF